MIQIINNCIWIGTVVDNLATWIYESWSIWTTCNYWGITCIYCWGQTVIFYQSTILNGISTYISLSESLFRWTPRYNICSIFNTIGSKSFISHCKFTITLRTNHWYILSGLFENLAFIQLILIYCVGIFYFFNLIIVAIQIIHCAGSLIRIQLTI